MNKLLLIMILMILVIGCGEKPKDNLVWRDDFRIERLPWITVLGKSDWIIDKGVWVVIARAPFEELAVVDRDWQGDEYQINTAMRLNETGEAGIVLGYQDAKNFWRITIDNSQNRIALIQRMGGNDRVVTESSISLSHREFHSLSAIVTKSGLKVQCDKLTVFDTNRPADSSGRLGIYAGIASPPDTPIYANFDNFEVKQVP